LIAARYLITFSGSSLAKFDHCVTVLDVSTEGILMRYRLLAAAATAILLITPLSVSAQYDDGYGRGGGRRGGGYCDQLRRACENKDSLGEVGEGNCRRFREECGRVYRDSGYGERGRSYGGREYGFDEGEYLRCNPDVLRAVRRGQMESGAAHYRVFGRRERRRLSC
jgi:hypothetical protein